MSKNEDAFMWDKVYPLLEAGKTLPEMVVSTGYTAAKIKNLCAANGIRRTLDTSLIENRELSYFIIDLITKRKPASTIANKLGCSITALRHYVENLDLEDGKYVYRSTHFVFKSVYDCIKKESKHEEEILDDEQLLAVLEAEGMVESAKHKSNNSISRDFPNDVDEVKRCSKLRTNYASVSNQIANPAWKKLRDRTVARQDDSMKDHRLRMKKDREYVEALKTRDDRISESCKRNKYQNLGSL